jgi:hypothetical protein
MIISFTRRGTDGEQEGRPSQSAYATENLMLQCAGKENEPCAAASELILLTRSPRNPEADALSLIKR